MCSSQDIPSGIRGYFLWGGVTGLKARYLISCTTSICEIDCGGGGVLEKDKYHPANRRL